MKAFWSWKGPKPSIWQIDWGDDNDDYDDNDADDNEDEFFRHIQRSSNDSDHPTKIPCLMKRNFI